MKSFYSVATSFVLLITFISVRVAFAPHIHLPDPAAVIIDGLIGVVSIFIGNWLAEKAS